MRVIEMECEGCERLVRTSQDGDRCGPCDLAMCASCLAGTQRCPSCQKPFNETRDRAPVVLASPATTEPPWLRVALLAGLAIALGFAYVSFSGGSSEPTVVERVDFRITRVPLSSAPCRVNLAGHRVPSQPIALADLLAGPEALRELLQVADAQLLAPEGADLATATHPPGPSRSEVVLVVDEWTTPTLLNAGQMAGRLYVRERRSGRVLCGTEVQRHTVAAGGFRETQAGRVELIRLGLVNGIAALREVR
ncbi:MAG: hypothetical protein AB8I08_05615 [Sandaracinaceae bacterium]